MEKIEDLAKPTVKAIAIADPEKNSVGKHALEALQGAGIYAQVKDKIAQTTYAADSMEMSEKGQVEATLAYSLRLGSTHCPGRSRPNRTGSR